MTTISSSKARAILHETKYRSKLERDFALHLAASGAEFYYEPFRLKLADGAYYKPDFLLVSPTDSTLIVYEVKGHWREAAKVRIKVAAGLHPYLRLVIVTRKNGEWDFEEV